MDKDKISTLERFRYFIYAFVISGAVVLPILVHAIFVSSPQDPILTGDITSDMILDETIVNEDISPSAEINARKIRVLGNQSSVLLSDGTRISTTTTLSHSTTTNTTSITGNLTVTGNTSLNGVSYTWPAADGSAGQMLSTNAAGTLSWSSTASTFSITAGQTMQTNDPVTFSPVTTTETDFGSDCCGVNDHICYSTNEQETAVSFEYSTPKLIKQIGLGLGPIGSPPENVTVAIVPDENGSPSRTIAQASTTLTTANIPGSQLAWAQFYPAVYVPENTKMWVRMYCANGSISSTNSYNQYRGTTGYTNGYARRWDGTNWIFHNIPAFSVDDVGVTATNLYLSSALATTSASTTIGILTANVSTSSSGSVASSGNLISNLRTMTLAKTLYLGNDPRTFSTTPGKFSKPLGLMITATQALLHIIPW